MHTMLPELESAAAAEASAILLRRGVLLYDEPQFVGAPRAAAAPQRPMPAMLDGLLSAPGRQERQRLVAGILHSMGVDWLSYGRMRVVSNGLVPLAYFTTHGDAAWHRRYVAEAYHEVDPRIRLAMASILPVTWTLSELAQAAGAEPKALRFLHDLQATGMRSGVVLSLLGPQPQERTLVSLLSRQSSVCRASDVRLGQVLVLGMCLHEFYTRYAPAPIDAADVAANLTHTQRAILQCLMRGMADKQIASCLALSPHTVDYHMRQLRKRFGARNRTQLMPAALRQGGDLGFVSARR